MVDASLGEELETVLEELVVNPARRDELGSRAVELIASNRGATKRTQRLLETYLVRNATGVPERPGA